MNSQLQFRGLPLHMRVNDVVETDREATFLGRKTNIESPVKAPVKFPEETQFRGRHVNPGIAGYKPRPGEHLVNGRLALQLARSRSAGRKHPAFRSA